MTDTVSGNRGLTIEEKMIFEQDSPGQTAVDLPYPPKVENRLGKIAERSQSDCRVCQSRRSCVIICV